MSYDTPFAKEIVNFPSSAFGAATESRRYIGPKGKKGLVKDIRSNLSADAIGTTTVPEVTVGSAASAVGALFAEYGRHRLGTTAVAGNTAAATPYRARNLALSAAGAAGGAKPALNDYAGHVALETAPIPADTVFFLTRVAGAGGAPAGTGSTDVEIWWD